MNYFKIIKFKFLINFLYFFTPLFGYAQAGSLDFTFNGLVLNQVGSITDFAQQSDGKVIIVGTFQSINGISSPGIARLNIDGGIDSSFNVGTGFSNNSDPRLKVIVQPDNKIIVAGMFLTFNGIVKNSIVRLNQNGSIDTSFNSGIGLQGTSPYGGGGVVPGEVRFIKLKSNGQILIAGGGKTYNGVNLPTTNTTRIFLINSNGILDTTFNSIGNNFFINALDLQNDGKIVIFTDKITTFSGINQHQYYLRRLNANGTVDNTFTLSNTILSQENINGIPLNNSGEYLRISEIKCLTSGKILIGGTFLNTFGNNNKNVCRLNSNGTVDNSFQGGVNSSFARVQAIEELPDGKIIIGGKFTSYNTTNSNHLIRVNSNGTIDNSFNSGDGFSGNDNITNDFPLFSIKRTLTNKLFVIGRFDGYNNTTINSIARINLTCDLSPTLDLMIKDGIDDIGNEPNNITPYIWASTDIWIRNTDDGGLEHQNPEYHPTNPNYAYIRVTNRSCVQSNGNEVLKFYWAKAGSSLAWPASWDGNNYFTQGPLMGAPVGQSIIPILQPNQETIVKIPFIIPNPTNYSWFEGGEQWHFCLLARIESSIDLLNETSDLVSNVQNNNGIAWKNVTIVDVEANVTSGTIAVGNPFNTPRTFFLEFVKEDIETGKPIFEEAEVGIKMDDVLYQAWVRGGKEAQQLDTTLDEKRKIVKGNNVILDNISFNPNEIGFLTLDFNFLTKEQTEKSKFKYHVVQKDALTGAIVGGETYEIKKKTRTLFLAEAPDKEVDLNQALTISAEDINEPAIYNWYDNEGNLIYQGKDLQIATAVSEKYKLEVISTVDGFKDYVEVEVKLKPSTIETISPNPAQNNVTILYKLNSSSSAYLMILDYYGNSGTSNNYILDVNSNEINININNYPNGFYSVALVIDGNIVDAKILVKE